MSEKGNSRFAARYYPASIALAAAAATVLIAIVAPLTILVAFVGLLLCVVLGVTIRALQKRPAADNQPTILRLLLELAPDEEIADLHAEIAESLLKTSEHRDPIFRPLAIDRIQQVARDCKLLGDGRIEFASTESWRLVYEQLLRSPGLHLYRSVAYVETHNYWQDGPGRQSTLLNLELQASGVLSVERTVIVADHLWPEESLFPTDQIHDWIDEQHRHGIWLLLVRESALESEPDLLNDFGIYGSRAVGMQRLDPTGRTKRFVLSFSFEDVERAEQSWKRLAVYADSYRDLLDRQH